MPYLSQPPICHEYATSASELRIGNPQGPEKPNKKYYDPRMSLRSGEEKMADRLVKCMEDLKCIDRL